MPKNFTRRMNFERRAIVAIACYFLVMQAFLAALAGGLAAGSQVAGGIGGGGGFATALICHGSGATPEAPAEDGKPKFLCGLCVLATCSDTPPSAPVNFVPAVRTVTRVAGSADFVLTFSAFDPRAGRSRAPPALALS